VLAHELSHAILGHRLDSSYAFFDNLLVEDKDTFRHFGFARTQSEEDAANKKASELLANSLKDPQIAKNWQMANAALFFKALQDRRKDIPNLISGHLGDRVPVIAGVGSNVAGAAPAADQKPNPELIAALPIGWRVKLDPWNDKLELIKSKPVGTVAEREKMPFEVTPFMPYLTRYGTEVAKPIAASTAAQSDPKAAAAPTGKP
jgi:hypothetical protein